MKQIELGQFEIQSIVFTFKLNFNLILIQFYEFKISFKPSNKYFKRKFLRRNMFINPKIFFNSHFCRVRYLFDMMKFGINWALEKKCAPFLTFENFRLWKKCAHFFLITLRRHIFIWSIRRWNFKVQVLNTLCKLSS